MEPIYALAESTVCPIVMEVTSTTVFLRKDITSEERTDMNGSKILYWKYQEAQLTPNEFNQYMNTISLNNANGVQQIIKTQENSDGNLMSVMEAIADLYDTFAQ